MINIAGIDKFDLIAALYNHSVPMGMGMLHGRPGPLQEDPAASEKVRSFIANNEVISSTGYSEGKDCLKFDYLFGRPIKADITGDTFDPFGYDRDNGDGAAKKIVERLRSA